MRSTTNLVAVALGVLGAAGVVCAVVVEGKHGPGRDALAVVSVLAAFAVPLVGSSAFLARRTALELAGAIGVAATAILAYWAIASFALIEAGALPNRWVSGVQVAVVVLVGSLAYRSSWHEAGSVSPRYDAGRSPRRNRAASGTPR